MERQMKPIKVWHIIIPEQVRSKLSAGQVCSIEQKQGTFMITDEDDKTTPVQIVPRLIRPPNWRDKKKARGNA
jgi:hypothetical protein